MFLDFGLFQSQTSWGPVLGGLGRHFGGLGRYLGHGLGPDEAWRRQNGLDCTLMQAGALFSQDPGIQGTAKVDGDLGFLGPTINLTTV